MNRSKQRNASARRDRPGTVPTRRGDRGVHDALMSSHVDALLDEGLAETFPASDPVAVTWPGAAGPGNL